MKKLNAMIYTIIMVISILGSSVTAEEDTASLDVRTGDNGGISIAVKIDPNLSSIYTDIYVFKEGEIITENAKDLPNPVYWHHAWDGASFSYSGSPGKYYAVLLEVTEKVSVVAGPIEFEITEITEPPIVTPTAPLTEPPVTPTPDAASPTVKPATPTPDQTATPTMAASVKSDGDNDIALWICIGAAAVVTAGIVIIILLKKKK